MPRRSRARSPICGPILSWRPTGGEELSRLDGFRIGIVWQGSRKHPYDRLRSMPLAQFAPLARLPGVRLISLQKNFGSEQIATVDFPVLDLSGRLDEAAGPFMDTAAVISNLDLVVTVDTAIAHLVGALGTPVFVALHRCADWRWLRDRDDTPWYPTMRLFRQTKLGQWSDVFERIAQAVEESPVRRQEQIAMTMPGQTPEGRAEFDALVALARREHQAGRLAEAAAACRKILALRPDLAEPHNNLGVILAQQGDLGQAATWFEKAVNLRPGYVEAHKNLGNALFEPGPARRGRRQFSASARPAAGSRRSASQFGRHSLESRKDRPGPKVFRAGAGPGTELCRGSQQSGQRLLETEQTRAGGRSLPPGDRSETRSRRSAQRPRRLAGPGRPARPGPGPFRTSRCFAAKLRRGAQQPRQRILEPEQARAGGRAISASSGACADHAEAHNNLGYVLRKQGHLERAAMHSQRALALRPNYAEAYANLGNVLAAQGQLEAAVAHLERALALKLDYAEAHNNLGNVLITQRKLDQAEAQYRQALALQPSLAAAEVGLSICHFVKGDYDRAWPAYEARLRVPGAMPLPKLPRWTGEDLTGAACCWSRNRVWAIRSIFSATPEC